MRDITSELNEKLKNAQQTPANNSDPKMSVRVSRARTTVMDSEYWTVETIREKPDLGDISVAPRRNKAYGTPNRIYDIHVENGIVNTAIREYPDRLKDGWKEQFILGPGISVAIAFDGNWERYRRLWRLVTKEQPWIFWVDNNNVLWRQFWDDESTKFELASNIVYVRAIRAWKNVNFLDRDQGIVIGYIKTDGTVWYRNYCQQINGISIWESERQITDFVGTAVSLNLFITNDYRIGFMVEDSLGKIHMLLTTRNWAGMAIQSENFVVRLKAKLDLLEVTYVRPIVEEHFELTADASLEMLFGRTDNSIVNAENVMMIRLDELLEEYEDWGIKVRAELNYKSNNIPTFRLIDKTTLTELAVASVTEIVAGYEYEILVDETVLEFGFNIVEGEITVEVSNYKNEADISYAKATKDFLPSNLIPPDVPIPEVEAIWNE